MFHANLVFLSGMCSVQKSARGSGAYKPVARVAQRANKRPLTQTRPLRDPKPCLTAPAGAFDDWPRLPTTLPTSGTKYLLGFEGAEFKGPIPTQFGYLTEITEINLKGNSLSATIPTELGMFRCALVWAWLGMFARCTFGGGAFRYSHFRVYKASAESTQGPARPIPRLQTHTHRPPPRQPPEIKRHTTQRGHRVLGLGWR